MKTLTFTTTIHSSRKKVWDILWSDAGYRQWTSVFTEGSYAVSDWQEGSKVLFLSPAGEGMFSIINKKIPDAYMSFKHMGVVKDGIEQPPTAASEAWAGATENYALEEKDGITTLTVTMDITAEFEQYFTDTFPKALQKVKELAEAQ